MAYHCDEKGRGEKPCGRLHTGRPATLPFRRYWTGVKWHKLLAPLYIPPITSRWLGRQKKKKKKRMKERKEENERRKSITENEWKEKTREKKSLCLFPEKKRNLLSSSLLLVITTIPPRHHHNNATMSHHQRQQQRSPTPGNLLPLSVPSSYLFSFFVSFACRTWVIHVMQQMNYN